MVLVDYDDVDEPQPGIHYRDRLGPWFDGDGTEIIPVGTEAVDLAVELVVGTFDVRSTLPNLDAFTIEVTFPLLTDLIQQDWDRVVEGSEQGILPGRGFLIAYEGAGAAIGRLAEDLLCDVVLERVMPAVCPGGTALTAADAAAEGNFTLPTPGPRSDDLVIVGDDRLTIVESKCTIGTWGRLRPMGRRAITQLAASAGVNPGAAALLVASSLRDKRVGVWHLARGAAFNEPMGLEAEWNRVHRGWAPPRRPGGRRGPNEDQEPTSSR